ncbi:MGMT family protein [Fictibacillus iocasae]|uniref:MGMT family protein n=1 Tax=Fictibacillus iocasae TaxID=2715437 RepID=A0ABW2NV40_9BACL
MTYGQIAAAAGSPRAARQVVRILHAMSEKHSLPWHRVINAKGEIGFRDEEKFSSQKLLLQNEKVQFIDIKTVDLISHVYSPAAKENPDNWI